MPSYFAGLKYIPASKATLIVNVHPLIVAVIAFFILKEKLTKSKVLLMIGSFIGVGFLSIHNNDTNESSSWYLLGISLVFMTSGMLAVIFILQRILNQHLHYALSPFY